MLTLHPPTREAASEFHTKERNAFRNGFKNFGSVFVTASFAFDGSKSLSTVDAFMCLYTSQVMFSLREGMMVLREKVSVYRRSGTLLTSLFHGYGVHVIMHSIVCC